MVSRPEIVSDCKINEVQNARTKVSVLGGESASYDERRVLSKSSELLLDWADNNLVYEDSKASE